MMEYDNIRLCEKCGEYTTGRLCRSCALQEMIDNDTYDLYVPTEPRKRRQVYWLWSVYFQDICLARRAAITHSKRFQHFTNDFALRWKRFAHV